MKKKGTMSTAVLVLVLFIGLSLLLYPSFSDYWNSKVTSRAVTNYVQEVAQLDDDQYKAVWESAWEYNRSLLDRTNPYILDDNQRESYDQLLNVGGSGIMGYIEIPSLVDEFAVYHGVSEPVLQIAVGHLDWTSLPAGGESTHCVFSGHRGLPSARLFTDLDELVIGDVFILHILDEMLTYEVDQILIVEPNETEELLIQEGKDLCTLVTCTPYGVNTHRLLVRGHRIENAEEAVTVRVAADAVEVDSLIVACVLMVPFLTILVTGLLIFESFNNKKKK